MDDRSSIDLIADGGRVSCPPPYTFYAVACLWRRVADPLRTYLTVRPIVQKGIVPVTADNVGSLKDRGRLDALEDWPAECGPRTDWEYVSGCVGAHMVTW